MYEIDLSLYLSLSVSHCWSLMFSASAAGPSKNKAEQKEFDPFSPDTPGIFGTKPARPPKDFFNWADQASLEMGLANRGQRAGAEDYLHINGKYYMATVSIFVFGRRAIGGARSAIGDSVMRLGVRSVRLADESLKLNSFLHFSARQMVHACFMHFSNKWNSWVAERMQTSTKSTGLDAMLWQPC